MFKFNPTYLAAIMILTGSIFASCCGSASKDKACDKTATEETKKPPIDLNTKEVFIEFDKTPPTQVNDRVVRRMAYLNDLMICIVDITGPADAPDPFHSHVAEQVCYIAEGEAIVIIGDKQRKLKQGDIFIVPSNVPHTVQALTPKLRLVDTFNPIREDFLQK